MYIDGQQELQELEISALKYVDCLRKINISEILALHQILEFEVLINRSESLSIKYFEDSTNMSDQQHVRTVTQTGIVIAFEI